MQHKWTFFAASECESSNVVAYRMKDSFSYIPQQINFEGIDFQELSETFVNQPKGDAGRKAAYIRGMATSWQEGMSSLEKVISGAFFA